MVSSLHHSQQNTQQYFVCSADRALGRSPTTDLADLPQDAHPVFSYAVSERRRKANGTCIGPKSQQAAHGSSSSGQQHACTRMAPRAC